MFQAINAIKLDVLAAFCCKDFEGRRGRAAEQARAKAEGDYRGQKAGMTV
jgi:hypothetical protein